MGWSFTHPNGYTAQPACPGGYRPVRLVMSSDDILHSLYIPFRLKPRRRPGSIYQVLFWGEEPGEYQIFFAQIAAGRSTRRCSRRPSFRRQKTSRVGSTMQSNVLDRLAPDEAGKQIFSARFASLVTARTVARASVHPFGVFGKTTEICRRNDDDGGRELHQEFGPARLGSLRASSGDAELPGKSQRPRSTPSSRTSRRSSGMLK